MSQGSTTNLPARLFKRTTLVTGAARGIGRAIALRLAREGSAIVAVDTQADGLQALASQLTGEGARLMTQVTDITQRGQVRHMLDRVDASGFGPIDGLVNNAAVGRPAPFLEIEDADWHRMLSVNLTGTFMVAQEVARRMVRHGTGRIVNIGSLAAHTANGHQAAYAASKGAITAMTRVMAFELAPQGIVVNSVCPGPIDTELAASMLTPQARRAREQRIPLGKIGRPDDVAGLVAFLLSDDAAYINGADLVVDGGLLIAGIEAQ
jgi:NAD(P)-dependent dehydrogenase (short-subunit alcohol dehydrogenase family)